jgi:hypothetical protein
MFGPGLRCRTKSSSVGANMRVARPVLVLCTLLLAIPSWGKQPPQGASTPQPASDPQAVAVVQAAITALGGATAIGQAQSWTFQATVRGPMANGNVSYTLGWEATPKRARLTQSLFVPAVIAPVLLDESKNSQFVIWYGGTTTIDSKLVTTILFSVVGVPSFTSQTWWFDTATGLPRRVEFQLPAELGSRKSFPGVIDLSNFEVVSGISYPFQIITILGVKPPQVITIQSVSPSTAPPSTSFDPTSGDI